MDKLLKLFLSLFVAGSTASAVAPISEPPMPTVTSQIASDGNETLSMKKQINGNLTTYTFSEGNNIVLTRTVSASDNFSIPFNTFSPDDKYFFIKENTGSVVNYWIYPGGANVTDFFNQKLPNYKLTDVTGWASDTLLVVNTNKADGSEGFSYWFDVTNPNHNFTQLAERFD